MSNTLRYNNAIPGNIYYNNAKVQNVYYNNSKEPKENRLYRFDKPPLCDNEHFFVLNQVFENEIFVFKLFGEGNTAETYYELCDGILRKRNG